MPLCHSRLVLSAAWGGERQRSSLSIVSGYSARAQCTGNNAYLEPNRNRMQKPIEGLSAPQTLSLYKRGAKKKIAQQLHTPTHHAAKLYQHGHSNSLTEVMVLSESHRVIKKNFETEMWIDGQKLPLNHFMQETIANVMVGFSKTLKGLQAPPEKIKVRITKLAKQAEVDAHTYP